MNLHTNNQLFDDAVVATAQNLKIPEIYVEKDYWVTVALHAIFHSKIADEAVFKGGTALSKCHKLINRFSEDVDMVVLNNNGESGNRLKNKLKAISEAVNTVMPEIDYPGITNKMGMIRKTAHRYQKQKFNGIYGQVREEIIIESSWLGSSEPYVKAEVSCYIYDMMHGANQNLLISKYNMQPFQVKVLSKERTFCEKIMSLVRFSNTEKPLTDLANKIRHIYDLNQMLKNKEIESFFYSSEFIVLLIKVANDDVQSFKNNNSWLQIHPSAAIIFSKANDTWSKIRGNYHSKFKELVIGELPSEVDLIATLTIIYDRLKNIKWQIIL
jgi:hypothetical protein